MYIIHRMANIKINSMLNLLFNFNIQMMKKIIIIANMKYWEFVVSSNKALNIILSCLNIKPSNVRHIYHKIKQKQALIKVLFTI